MAVSLGKMPTTSVRRLISPFRRSNGFVELDPMGGREAHVGQHVGLGRVHQNGELAQEGGPERLGLRRADVHAEDLAPAVGVHADRHDHRHRDDPAGLANLHVGRIDPEIRPLALMGRSRNAPTRSSISWHKRRKRVAAPWPPRACYEPYRAFFVDRS